MKWYGVTGSWRLTSPEVEKDVRFTVRQVMNEGHGIVTGGALNVDSFATDEALIVDPSGKRLCVILPTTLTIFAAHFRKRAAEGVITTTQAEDLIAQLTQIHALGSLTEMNYLECNQDTYYDRNTKVVEASDGLLAFHVNGSGGVQDTVDKARANGIEVILKSYTL